MIDPPSGPEGVRLGEQAHQLRQSPAYKYAMRIMQERLWEKWINSDSAEDRETLWAFATAHRNLDQTLQEFVQNADSLIDLEEKELVGEDDVEA